MARTIHAKRYARAAFEIAREKDQLDRWQADLAELARLVQDEEIRPILEAPRCSFEDKVRLLKEKLARLDPLVLNLAQLLVAKNQISLAPGIAEEYRNLLNSVRGIEQAEVVTAVPLSEDESEAIKASIRSLTGKEIILKAQVDPRLLGGVVIRFNDKLIDGSTRSRLEALKSGLVGAGR